MPDSSADGRTSPEGREAMTILEFLGDVLLIGCGTALLVMFLTIAATGKYAFEPNPVILWVEVAMSIAIIAVGINRLGDDWRKK